MHVFRTLAGGWATHHRLHLEPRPCKFCGRDDDVFGHYLTCKSFLRVLAAARWAIQGRILESRFGAGCDLLEVLVGMGLLGNSPFHPASLAVASLVYHKTGAQCSFDATVQIAMSAWGVWGVRALQPTDRPVAAHSSVLASEWAAGGLLSWAADSA